jgi:hypothetical protein
MLNLTKLKPMVLVPLVADDLELIQPTCGCGAANGRGSGGDCNCGTATGCGAGADELL